MEETRNNTINAIIYLADYVDSNVPIDYDYALTRLLQLRENLEASSCHLEDAVRAHGSMFDEVEHLIRHIGNISEIQPCLDIQRDQLQLQISFGIPRREIARRFGVSLKTLHRRIALRSSQPTHRDLQSSQPTQFFAVPVYTSHYGNSVSELV